MELLPVTLITGFLGSGKSTLLTQILDDPGFGDSAVVVNEFGAVGLDGFLVEHRPEQLVEMTTGCLCCTIRGDIRETLLDLHARRDSGVVPRFSRVIVETTGLADPAPVIHTLIMDPNLANRFRLGGVIATIDAVNGDHTLDDHAECVKQAAVADRLVLTKTDLVAERGFAKTIGGLTDRLRRLNPGAEILDRTRPDFDLRRLFDTSLYDPATKTADVRQWLNEESYNEPEESHHHLDVNRHDADIHSFTVSLEEPIRGTSLMVALEHMTAHYGRAILRLKGIAHIREEPARPVVIHGVQHLLHEMVWLDEWPTADRRTRLVFVTRGIAKDAIENFLTDWLAGGERKTAAMLGLSERARPSPKTALGAANHS